MSPRSTFMMHRPNQDRKLHDEAYVSVARPAKSDGIGRALQVAFRDGYELPPEFQECLRKLDRVQL